MKEVKLYNIKMQEVQIVNEELVEMTVKIWVRYHNERNAEKITKKDIIRIN